MKLKRQLFIYITLISTCLLCVSCVRVNYPNRTKFMLQVQTPKPLYQRPRSQTINIQNVTAVPQFSGVSFVYRTGQLTYTKDYYNTFFIPPTQQISQLITKYLQATNLFKHVSDSVISTTYTLHANVLKLYADYRDSSNPKAVIAIRYVLLRPAANNKILLAKTFTAVIPLKAKNSHTLVAAWNRGLTTTLVQLTNKLKQMQK